MALLRLLIAAVVCALAAAPSLAQPVRVTISETPEGVRIVYDLARPAAVLVIGEDQGPWPSEGFRLAEAGLRVENGAIRSARPFRRATLQIAPDTRDRDARYPFVTRIIGRGHVLFAPYILPSGEYRLEVATRGRWVRQVSRQEAEGGYLVVGELPRRGGAFDVLTGADVSSHGETHLHERASRLLGFYAERLRRPVPRRPIIVIAQQEPTPGRPGFRGDVTRNGLVMLRFRGGVPGPGQAERSARATLFLAHELFHLWNAPGGRGGGLAEAWLHEGSADYYGWRAASALWPAELRLEAELQRALDGCMRFGGGRPLARLDPNLRYQCGAVVHWISDLALRQGSGGRSEGFDLWAALVARRSSGYTLTDFRSAQRALAPSAAAAVDGIIDTGWDWPAIARLANAAGAEVTLAVPGDQALRFAAARAVAGGLCSAFGGGGWNERNEYYFTGVGCADLGDTVFLLAIAGIDPMADAARAYGQVERACRERREITVRLRGQRGVAERAVRCRGAFEAAPAELRIVRALPLNPAERSSL